MTYLSYVVSGPPLEHLTHVTEASYTYGVVGRDLVERSRNYFLGRSNRAHWGRWGAVWLLAAMASAAIAVLATRRGFTNLADPRRDPRDVLVTRQRAT